MNSELRTTFFEVDGIMILELEMKPQAYEADYLKRLLGAQGKNDGTYYLGRDFWRARKAREIKMRCMRSEI